MSQVDLIELIIAAPVCQHALNLREADFTSQPCILAQTRISHTSHELQGTALAGL